jgi:hypothetical protein
MWNWLTPALGLLGFGTGIFARSAQRQTYDRQAAQITQMQARTAQEMRFNQEIAAKTGIEGVEAILESTNQQVSQALVDFSSRGVGLEGTPMQILGNMQNMGAKKAQQFIFNTKVQAIGQQNAGFAQLANYQFQKQNAQSNMRSSTLGMLADTVQALTSLPLGGGLSKPRAGGPSSTGISSSVAASQGIVRQGIY